MLRSSSNSGVISSEAKLIIKKPFLLYLLVLAPVMPHEYLSGRTVASKWGRGAQISSVVIETSNKKESSITLYPI